MIYKVQRFIEKHSLLNTNDKVLVALSGGADSVALLVAMRKLGYKCEAMHCNFHLRGAESDRDEQFVTELCKRLEVELHIIHFDTAEYASKHRISIEMAARELRYAAFEEKRRAIGATCIAVAHHRDDSAETLLLNLTRGTGIKGLRGIQPKNGNIVRPLLCAGREEIIEYLKWRGEEFVTDSTNLTTDYTRNKIRLEIIPKLREINPSVLESINATAQRLSEAELIYRKAVEDAIARVKSGNRIDIRKLKAEVAPATLIHEMLSPLGFNSSIIADIASSLDSDSGKRFCSGAWLAVKDRDTLIITANSDELIIEEELPEYGTVTTSAGLLSVEEKPFDGNIPREQCIACLDIDTLQLPLILRNTRKGDRFKPFGMRGTKLVSDYLTDRKKSIIEKQQQLVVADAKGEIAWLVGERPATPFCVGKNTKKVLCLKWQRK